MGHGLSMTRGVAAQEPEEQKEPEEPAVPAQSAVPELDEHRS